MNPDEKEIGEAWQKESDSALEMMLDLFEPNPWLEISYLIQTQAQSTYPRISSKGRQSLKQNRSKFEIT